MPRLADIYIHVLTGLALIVLFLLGAHLRPHHWPLLVSLIITTVVFNLWRAESPTGQTITFNSAVNMAAILLGGPPFGVWVVAIGQVLSATILGWDSRRTVFNTAQIVLATGTAGAVYEALGGGLWSVSVTAMPAVGTAIVYFLVNSVLMAGLFHFLHRKPVVGIWTEMVKQGIQSYALVQILGLVATFVVVKGGVVWSIILISLLISMQRVVRGYYRAVKESSDSSRLRAVQDSLLQALITALDARDIYTSGHSGRVAHYVELLSTEMGLSERVRDELRYASLLHDVGKLGIPDSVLRKDGPLSATERALMMEHPDRGIAILGKMQNIPDSVFHAVRHHHEWFNGGGYPAGLKGEEIPLGARIVAVADAFDAMTSARPYRMGIDFHEALNRIRQGRGTQFDPQVVDAALQVFARDPEAIMQVITGGQTIPSVTEDVAADRAITGLPDAGRILPVHSKEVKILYHLSLERRSLLDVSKTLHRTLEVLYDTIGPNRYFVLLLDESSDELVVRAATGSETDARERRVPADSPYWSSVLSKQQPVLLTKAGGTPHAVVGVEAHTVLGVPLVSGSRTIGVLQAESSSLNAFGEEEVYLLTAVAGRLSDALEVANAHEMMTYAATHDGLTGALNRSTFFQMMSEELLKAGNENYPFSVAILDLDGFKSINDRFGHPAGDRVIVQYVSYLHRQITPAEVLARYGGDEFAIILRGLDREEAAERIRWLTGNSTELVDIGDRMVRLPNASWGIAAYPADGSTTDELIATADQRMYHRKLGRMPNEMVG